MNGNMINTIFAFWMIAILIEPNFTYAVLHCCITKKLKGDKEKKDKNKKILKDAMLVTIAGISAAMKNTG